MEWLGRRNLWKGVCPVCGISSYFTLVWTHIFPDDTDFDVVECPGGHPFSISSKHGYERAWILYMAPISGDIGIPSWLPEIYKNTYGEMMFDHNSGKYKSAVAMAGIILDAHINSFLLSSSDRYKPLGKRMEMLSKRGHLDADQFAEGTVARLARNEVVHPDNIDLPVTKEESEEVIDAVSACLERFYKFRRAKALPAPSEQIGTPDKMSDEAAAAEG